MHELYPFRFRPVLRRYMWGGRRLGSLLGKPLGPGNDYAESWEVVDRHEDQSMVQFGPLAGATLGELVRERGQELLGVHHPKQQFPLLVKFLDARKNLSLQVHPNDEQAARQTQPDSGKTEAWVVVAAEPGSLIYAGLRPGVDRSDLERAVLSGTCEEKLHRFEPAVGDCVFLPSGTVHALGAGLLVAEIQQSSDTTFRLFDWNRPGPDGNPRPLHVEQALEVIVFDRGPIAPQRPRPGQSTGQEILVECEHFVLRRWRLDRPQRIGGDSQCHIVTVVEGSIQMEGAPSGEALTAGSTALLPASVGQVAMIPDGTAVLLESHLS